MYIKKPLVVILSIIGLILVVVATWIILVFLSSQNSDEKVIRVTPTGITTEPAHPTIPDLLKPLFGPVEPQPAQQASPRPLPESTPPVDNYAPKSSDTPSSDDTEEPDGAYADPNEGADPNEVVSFVDASGSGTNITNNQGTRQIPTIRFRDDTPVPYDDYDYAKVRDDAKEMCTYMKWDCKISLSNPKFWSHYSVWSLGKGKYYIAESDRLIPMGTLSDNGFTRGDMKLFESTYGPIIPIALNGKSAMVTDPLTER